MILSSYVIDVYLPRVGTPKARPVKGRLVVSVNLLTFKPLLFFNVSGCKVWIMKLSTVSS